MDEIPMSVGAMPLKPSGAESVGLAGRSLGALKWNYLGTAVKVGSQLVIGIVLARLLGPEPFGLIAIAWLMLGLGNLIADSGLSAALIQKQQISARDIRYVFTLQILASLALTLLAVLASPWIAGFFGRADAVPVLRWMSLLFVFQAFGQTATALLRRDLNHKRVQLLQVFSYLAAYLLLGLPLAFTGMGVWALVIAQLTQAILYSVTVYLSGRHPLKPAFSAEQPGLFRFGSKILGSNLSSWGYLSIDAAIIGRLLGVVDLGLYNRTMSLVSSPMYAIVAALQGVLFPLYSRLEGRHSQARQIYLASVCLLSIALVPMFATIAAIPETTILAIYGHDWHVASPLVTPLALAMPVYGVLALGGPMMQGMGRAGMEAASQGIGLIVLALAVIVAAHSSLAAVAWAVLAVYLLRALLVTRLAASLISVTAWAIARALAGPALLGLFAALLASQADQWLISTFSNAGLRFIAVIGMAIAAVLITAMVLGRWIFCIEARVVLQQATGHMPRWLRPGLFHWCKA